MPVSLAPKPVPVRVMVAPGAAFVLLAEILGVTAKDVSGTELDDVVAPLASIVREPEAEAGILNMVLQMPLLSAEVEDTSVPS